MAEIKEELTLPEFPKELSYLWRAYHRVRRRMGGGFAGPNPIGWRDIQAFMHVTRFRLSPWEVELLEAMDDAYLQPQLVALKAKTAPVAATEMIDVNDTKSARALLRSIGKRRVGKEKT